MLVTSSTEAHSLVTYEAMGCGIPVVTTRVGDVEENIIDGVNGFLLPVDCSVEQIVPLLVRLRDDPTLRAMMGEEAMRTVLERWTWGRVAESYVDAFRTIMGISTHYKRKVGFLWWYNPYTATETSVLTIQKQALEQMGVDVEVFNIGTVFDKPDELARLNDVDLIFTSVMPLVLEDERYNLIKSPVLFQIDGYGSTTFYDGYCNPLFPKLTEKASLVTFLDMNVYEELVKSGLRFDWDKIFFVPNGSEDLTKDAEARDYRKPDETLIGSLMKENQFKEPWQFLDAYKEVHQSKPNTRLLYPVLGWKTLIHDYSQLGWPKDRYGLPSEYEYENGETYSPPEGKAFDREHGNVMDVVRVRFRDLMGADFIQHIPYRMIPAFINSCDIFAHYSSGDAFAKTVTEAFSLGKAPIVSNVTRIQSIETGGLAKVKEAIGKPMPSSYEATMPLFLSGHMKHLYVVPRRSPSLCAEALLWAIDHPKEYGNMGAEAKRWSDEWLTWGERWQRIFELAEEKKIL